MHCFRYRHRPLPRPPRLGHGSEADAGIERLETGRVLAPTDVER
jgi:hypothetical protein